MVLLPFWDRDRRCGYADNPEVLQDPLTTALADRQSHIHGHNGSTYEDVWRASVGLFPTYW